MSSGSILSGLGIRDQYGTTIDQYHFLSDPGFFDIGSQSASVSADLFFNLAMIPGGLAMWLSQRTANPNLMFGGVSKAYETIVDPIFSVIPPSVFITMATVVALTMVMFRKSSSMGSRSSEVTRVITILALSIGLSYLATNPVRPVMKIMGVITDLLREFFAQTPGAASAMDTVLMPLAQIANFGRTLSPGCERLWAGALQSGQDAFTCDGIDVSNVTMAQTVGTIVVCIVVILHLVFQAIVFVLMWWHFVLALLSVTALFYTAAASLIRRHNFDLLSRNAAHLAANVLMLMAVTVLGVFGPALVTVLSGSILNDKAGASAGSALGVLAVEIMGYAALCFAAWKMVTHTGALATVLRGRNNTFLQDKIGYAGTSTLDQIKAAKFASRHDGAQSGTWGFLAAAGMPGTAKMQQMLSRNGGGRQQGGAAMDNAEAQRRQDEENMPYADRSVAPDTRPGARAGDRYETTTTPGFNPKAEHMVEPETGAYMERETPDAEWKPVTHNGTPVYVDPRNNSQYTVEPSGIRRSVPTDHFGRYVYAPTVNRVLKPNNPYYAELPASAQPDPGYLPERGAADRQTAETAETGATATTSESPAVGEATENRGGQPGRDAQATANEQSGAVAGADAASAVPTASAAAGAPSGAPAGAADGAAAGAQPSGTSPETAPASNQEAAPAEPAPAEEKKPTGPTPTVAPTTAAGQYGSAIVAPGPSRKRDWSAHPGMANYSDGDVDATGSTDSAAPAPQPASTPSKVVPLRKNKAPATEAWLDDLAPAGDDGSPWTTEDQMVLDGMEKLDRTPFSLGMPMVQRDQVLVAASLSDALAVSSMEADVEATRMASLASGGSAVVDIPADSPQMEIMMSETADGTALVEPAHQTRLDGFLG